MPRYNRVDGIFLCALFYLGIPVFLSLFTFFNYYFVFMAAIAMIILIASVYKHHPYNARYGIRFVTSAKRYWPLLIASSIVVLLSVTFSFKASDWNKHHAVFNMLSSSTWPPVFDLDNQLYVLRYYLGWYVVPALFGKIAGSNMLAFVIFVWTTAGISLSLMLCFHKTKKAKHFFILFIVFFFFSGLDIVGAFVMDYDMKPISRDWLQWWFGWGQVLPHTHCLTYFPQHTIPAWIATGMFLFNRRLTVQYGAVILAFTSMWSPLVTVGLALVFLYALDKERIKTGLTIQNLVAAPLLIIPIALYLTQGGSQEGAKLALVNVDITNLMTVWVFEFLIMGVVVYFAKNKQGGELILFCMLSLVVLSLIDIYPHKALYLRTAVPFIYIMSVLSGYALLNGKGLQRYLLCVYLVLTAIVPVVSFTEGIRPSHPKADRSIKFKDIEMAEPSHRHLYTLPVEHKNIAYHILGQRLLRGLARDDS